MSNIPRDLPLLFLRSAAGTVGCDMTDTLHANESSSPMYTQSAAISTQPLSHRKNLLQRLPKTLSRPQSPEIEQTRCRHRTPHDHQKFLLRRGCYITITASPLVSREIPLPCFTAPAPVEKWHTAPARSLPVVPRAHCAVNSQHVHSASSGSSGVGLRGVSLWSESVVCTYSPAACGSALVD